MTNYSIVRMGDDYVVCADDQSILKVASRRRAAQLVTNAVELMNSQTKPELHDESSPEEPPEVS